MPRYRDPSYATGKLPQPIYQPEFRGVDRNDPLGFIADYLAKVKKFGNQAQIPILGGVGDLFIGEADTTMDKLSWGEHVTKGSGQTTQLDPGLVDIAALPVPWELARRGTKNLARRGYSTLQDNLTGSTQEYDPSRRTLLKAITAGGALAATPKILKSIAEAAPKLADELPGAAVKTAARVAKTAVPDSVKSAVSLAKEVIGDSSSLRNLFETQGFRALIKRINADDPNRRIFVDDDTTDALVKKAYDNPQDYVRAGRADKLLNKDGNGMLRESADYFKKLEKQDPSTYEGVLKKAIHPDSDDFMFSFRDIISSDYQAGYFSLDNNGFSKYLSESEVPKKFHSYIKKEIGDLDDYITKNDADFFKYVDLEQIGYSINLDSKTLGGYEIGGF